MDFRIRNYEKDFNATHRFNDTFEYDEKNGVFVVKNDGTEEKTYFKSEDVAVVNICSKKGKDFFIYLRNGKRFYLEFSSRKVLEGVCEFLRFHGIKTRTPEQRSAEIVAETRAKSAAKKAEREAKEAAGEFVFKKRYIVYAIVSLPVIQIAWAMTAGFLEGVLGM